MTNQQRESLYRELGQIFIISWWDFETAFNEIMKVLIEHGFRLVETE